MSQLNTLLTNKKYAGKLIQGAGRLSESSNREDYPRLPTYIFPLDFCAAGGLPLNVMTMFYGSFQSGKSTTAYLCAKALSNTCIACLRPKEVCTCASGEANIAKTLLVHMEGLPPDNFYFDTLGYDTKDNLIIASPDNGEEACAIIEEGIQTDEIGLVIVDSLAEIVPSVVLTNDYSDLNVGGQAKLLTKLAHRLNMHLKLEARRGHKVGVIFINQLRASIGAGRFEPTETIPGGWAIKHACRLSVRFGQVKSNDVDEDVQLKNSARFTASTISNQSKQQMLMLAGKCEFEVALRDFDGYISGQVMDAKTARKYAKDVLGILEQKGKYYELDGCELKFKKLTDIDAMFQAGEYTDPETGEVTPNADNLFRYRVVEVAKERYVRNIVERAGGKVLTHKTGSLEAPAQAESEA